MLDLVYRVKIFFWGLRYIDFDRVHVMFGFDENIAFLHVFVDVDFNFYAITGDAANRMLFELVAFERNVDNFLVGTMVNGA